MMNELDELQAAEIADERLSQSKTAAEKETILVLLSV
jgi:hypothetical protein